jgi:ATP-dependent DNA ligase
MSLHPPGFIEPCLPTGSRTAPTGPQWAYEIKHDGFRFICHRDGERVRVFSRTGHEWGAQLPAIAAALRALPVRSVILDGEGVICGPDGVSDFDRMRAVFSRKGSPDVFLYAFDVLELDGRDLRAQRWDGRRSLLTQLVLVNKNHGLARRAHAMVTVHHRVGSPMGSGKRPTPVMLIPGDPHGKGRCRVLNQQFKSSGPSR